MEAHKIFNQIESLFSTMTIYKSVIVYNDLEVFEQLKELLVSNDYPLTSIYKSGRVYDIHMNKLKVSEVDWRNVSLILCLDNMSYDCVKEFVMNSYLCKNLNLMIKV